MNNLFRRLDEPGIEWIEIQVDGATVKARKGESVAAALLASGTAACRNTPVSGQPRAPFCMMGVCFECLVEIDGIPNRQGCRITVREGMSINRQQQQAQEFTDGTT